VKKLYIYGLRLAKTPFRQRGTYINITTGMPRREEWEQGERYLVQEDGGLKTAF